MERKNGRNHGEVFTDKNAVQFILDEVGYSSDLNLSSIKILEPASGNGAFATEIIKRLYKSSLDYQFSFIDSVISNLTFVELDAIAFVKLTKTIDGLIFNLTNQRLKLNSQICLNTNFLTWHFEHQFDCIVGNPPYIRHELIPENDKAFYRNKYKTFKYRADLYIPFFEYSLELLKPNGLLSFICSNRWLNNQYGKILREQISSLYNLRKVLNIEKSSPFDEAVTAYPCITTIQKSKRSEKVLFCEDNSKEIDFNSLKFEEVENPKNNSWQNLFLHYNINHIALIGIEEQGFEIGIGVATGADKVFIKNKNELNGIEKNRVLPIIKSTDLKNNTFKWTENYLINPYDNGELCDLENYPHLQTYFNDNKQTLLQRHTAKKTPNKWYKTIDKIKPELLSKPKLLLPDLTGNKFLFIDNGKFYPHHNLYYITADNISSLKILASILMSDFIKHQMSQIGIRMNGGLPRFQSQVLRQLKIPNINGLGNADRENLIKAYDRQDLETSNQIINKYCTQHGFCVMAGEVVN
ncbi:MAG: Eco57I restriction-modification methylase domain-containing protein [Rhodothermia bacterium]|nr:Eco57I restriction-modification methylase domain-containing protein [Rhodothermia bacterium]